MDFIDIILKATGFVSQVSDTVVQILVKATPGGLSPTGISFTLLFICAIFMFLIMWESTE